MRSILCILGMHKHTERNRSVIGKTQWCRHLNGVKVSGSDFEKVEYVVLQECERNGCHDQIAFREVIREGGNDSGKVEKNVRIHPDLAKELMFVEKV